MASPLIRLDFSSPSLARVTGSLRSKVATATMEDDYHVTGHIQMKRKKIPIFSPEIYHEEIEM